MITNFPKTGTQNIFTNKIVANAIKRVTGSFIAKELTSAEQISRDVEAAFAQGSTVNVKVKPALVGQKLVDANGNLTTKSMAFGNQSIDMDYIYGESIEITPQDLIAAQNGDTNALAVAVETVVDATMKIYESDQINNLRTASLGTTIGTGTTKTITYQSLSNLRREFSIRNFPWSAQIVGVIHPTFFAMVSRLNEVVSNQNVLGINGVGSATLNIPALNMTLIESANYTASAVATDPIITAWISGHALAPIRTLGVANPASGAQRLVRDTISGANVPVLLSISEVRQGGSFKHIIDASILSGFKFLTPQITEAGAVQFNAAVHVIGEIA
jgi:hypothetical protein